MRLHRAAWFPAFLLIAVGASMAEDPSPLAWASRMRGSVGLAPLLSQPLLAETARRHAEDLAARGEISHVGTGGTTVLERWRSAGGTSLRVGEIIGAGEALSGVENAWMESPSHRAVLLDPLWTHVGWGSAGRGTMEVHVVLFSRILVRDLVTGWRDGVFSVQGAFTPPEAASPILFCGIREMDPVSWDPGRRTFEFRIARADFVPYMRLGYRTSSGTLVLTDSLWAHGEDFYTSKSLISQSRALARSVIFRHSSHFRRSALLSFPPMLVRFDNVSKVPPTSP
jgi:hypothetical protein